jgi:hypothetical protein
MDKVILIFVNLRAKVKKSIKRLKWLLKGLVKVLLMRGKIFSSISGLNLGMYR